MAAPTVRAFGTATNGADAAPAFAVSQPAGVTTGDLLLAFAVCDTTTTAWTASPGNGWVQLSDEVQGSTHRVAVYAVIADGSDTLSIAGANNQDYSCVMVAITTGTHGVTNVSTDIVIPAAATSSTGNADPPNSGTVASKDWLAIAACGCDFTATGDAVSAAPTNYTTGAVLTKSAATTTSVGLGVGYRGLTAATSENPGTFTNTSRPWVAKTLLIPPPNTTGTPATIATAVTFPIPLITPAGATVSPATITAPATLPTASASSGGGGALTVTLDFNGGGDFTPTTTKSLDLPDWSVTSGNLLIVGCGGVCEGTGIPADDTNYFVVSGGGLTWTRRASANQMGAFTTAATFYTATATSTTTITDMLAVTTVGGLEILYAMYHVSGHDTGTPYGGNAHLADNSTDGSVEFTLSATPAASSIIIAVICENMDVRGDKTLDHGSSQGWTEDFDYSPSLTASGAYGGWMGQRKTGTTSTTVRVDDIKPASYGGTTYSFAGSALEIKSGGGGGGTDGTATPAVIARSATVPAPTVDVGSTLAPAVIASAALLPAPSATGGGAGTGSPAVIARSATMPAPSPTAGSTLAPAVIARSATLSTATASGGGGGGPPGTVTFGNATSGSTTAAVTSVTVAHTVAAQANSVLYVLASLGDTANDSGHNLSCTYNGVTGTSISGEIHSNASTFGFIELFWWPIGTGDGTSHNVVLTTTEALGGTNSDVLAAHAVSFYGAVQTEPTEATATGGSTPTLGRSSTANGQVLWGFGCGADFTTPTQTQQSVQNVNNGSGCGNSQTQTATGTGSTLTAADAGADFWAAIAVDIVGVASSGDATATPAVIARSASLPGASATGATAGTGSPAIIARAAILPAPSASGTASGTATPATIARAVTFPGTAAVDITVEPAVIARSATLPAPTASGSTPATATPATITRVALLPAPSGTGGTAGTASPATIARAALLPVPVAQVGSTLSPATIARLVLLPAPSATGSSAGNAAPATISRAAVLPVPSVGGGGGRTPATISVAVTVPAVTVSAGGSRSPAVIARVTVMPAPTASGSASGTATPATIARSVTLPAPNKVFGYVKTVTKITLAVTIPTPQAGSIFYINITFTALSPVFVRPAELDSVFLPTHEAGDPAFYGREAGAPTFAHDAGDPVFPTHDPDDPTFVDRDTTAEFLPRTPGEPTL